MSHPNTTATFTKTRYNSITMDLVRKAIEDIESREEGASFSYSEVAKRWEVNQSTLAR